MWRACTDPIHGTGFPAAVDLGRGALYMAVMPAKHESGGGDGMRRRRRLRNGAEALSWTGPEAGTRREILARAISRGKRAGGMDSPRIPRDCEPSSFSQHRERRPADGERYCEDVFPRLFE
jgi:hypothetical protein